MSYAILELALLEPTASLERSGHQWRARCERCGGTSKGYLRVSHALAAQHRHGQVHVAREAAELTVLLDTLRRPVEIRPKDSRRVAAEARRAIVVAVPPNGLIDHLEETG